MVVGVAVLVAVLPPLLWSQPWFDAIYRALALLIIACPCALVISTPVSIVSGLTAASRRGILVKGGVYLEEGRNLKWLALDKTGTLTHGKPVQTDLQDWDVSDLTRQPAAPVSYTHLDVYKRQGSGSRPAARRADRSVAPWTRPIGRRPGPGRCRPARPGQ